ncbi:MAG: TrmB protein [Patescibacteria group bacterium]|nr:TrmB protein [Patescibacteria group bacterium]
MFSKELQNLGLTKTQSAVLDHLFEHGESKACDIAKDVKHPRGVVYKAIDELIALELVEKQEKAKQIARFRAVHPRNLEKVLEAKERELSKNKKIFDDLLPQLASSYNLTLNKPGVKFYEGEEGLEKVLYDTLNSKTEVYLMFNREAMSQEPAFEEINDEYKRRRIRSGIKKKIIRIGKKPELTFGTADAKYDAVTEIKYLENTSFPFKTNIHIYDGKISFLIMEKGKIIAILIEDKNIYELNKFWFETLWKLAKN